MRYKQSNVVNGSIGEIKRRIVSSRQEQSRILLQLPPFQWSHDFISSIDHSFSFLSTEYAVVNAFPCPLLQARTFVPDLQMHPWRNPAPGEPAWHPILNCCEMKQGEWGAVEIQVGVVHSLRFEECPGDYYFSDARKCCTILTTRRGQKKQELCLLLSISLSRGSI